jgi:hypothetical protein
MSKRKHTPGPWSSEATLSSDVHFIRSIWSEEVGQIAKVRIGPVLEQEEALANASLIAAAPVMLERLESVAALLKKLYESPNLVSAQVLPIIKAELEETRRVIEKATK